MKVLRHTFAFLFLLITAAARAQFALLPDRVHDFGTVETWRNDPAVFRLLNTGSKPLAILKMTGSKNILAEYPKSYIAPGDTALVTLRYYTPDDGPFSENVEMMLSAAPQPVILTLRGKIKTLGADALTACPGEQLQGTAPSFGQTFVALDAQTGQVIPGALFDLGTRGESMDRFRVPVPGRAVNKTYPGGLYNLRLSADGYTPLDTGFVILAGRRSFSFYLQKDRREEIPVAEIPPPAEPEPEIRPQTPVIRTETKPEPVVAVTPADSLDTNPVLPLSSFKPNNIVFVLDVSSSMRMLGRIDMLKASMLKLTEVLRRVDRVSIITFTTSPLTRLQGVPGNQKDTLDGVIRSLNASGATNGIRGLRFAYGLAERHFIPDGNNVVIIGTDGVFAQTDENGTNISVMVDEYLGKGIKLAVMAFGRDADAIRSMEKMAARGKGGFMRMDNPAQAPALLLEQVRDQSRR